MRKQAVVARLVPNASRDDGRMNTKPLRQLHHGERGGRGVLDSARAPHIGGNETVLGPFIGFILLRISWRALDVAQTQIVDEAVTSSSREVSADGCEVW